MKQHGRRVGAIAIIAAATMMSSCSEIPAPDSTESPSSSISTSAAPNPSETLTAEQLEAATTLINYHRIRDEVYSSLDADPQPLKDITTGDMQTLQLDILASNREIGVVWKGFTAVHLLGSSAPQDIDGVRIVNVQICVDKGNLDVIDPNTGESQVIRRIQYKKENINVVRTEDGWKVGDGTGEEVVSGCPS